MDQMSVHLKGTVHYDDAWLHRKFSELRLLHRTDVFCHLLLLLLADIKCFTFIGVLVDWHTSANFVVHADVLFLAPVAISQLPIGSSYGFPQLWYFHLGYRIYLETHLRNYTPFRASVCLSCNLSSADPVSPPLQVIVFIMSCSKLTFQMRHPATFNAATGYYYCVAWLVAGTTTTFLSNFWYG